MLQLHYSHARFSDCRHAKELCTVSVDNLVSDATIIQLSVITVYSGSCDDLRQQTYSDDSGRCGNFKSTVFFPTVEGRTYYINVYPYYEGQAGISFGLILDDSLTFDEESSSGGLAALSALFAIPLIAAIVSINELLVHKY